MNNVTGDIEATVPRGDIVFMLSGTGAYSIDAKSKFGPVLSDFEGATNLSRYRLGERFTSVNSSSSRRLYLRMKFGGITIKAVPSEAF